MQTIKDSSGAITNFFGNDDEKNVADSVESATPQTNEQTDDFKAVADVVGERAARILAAAGLTTLAQLDASNDDELLAVEGVGSTTVEKLRERAK